jgi:hypothetical protein
MIAGLLIGREGSAGFPGKNLHPLLGRPLMAYPLLAAQNAPSVNEVYVSTDSPKIKELARNSGAHVIDRPAHLCTNEALGEDAFKHGYDQIRASGKNPEFMVLLFANAPCVRAEQIEDGIRLLREHPDADSAVTVSRYNMYSPVRARRVGEDGLLHPFIPFESYPPGIKISCDRDAQGDVFFADVCLSVVRPKCLDDLNYGILPQRWMGRKILPIRQEGGLDVDYAWQLPVAEHWLRKNGFDEEKTPYRRP